MQEEAEKNAHHDVKNFFTAESIGEASEEIGEQEGPGENRPDFDERDRLGARLGGSDYQRVFTSAQSVVIEGNEKEHEEHGEEFFQFPAVDWPEERTPLSKFYGLRLFAYINRFSRFLYAHQHGIFRYLIKRE